MDLELYVLNSSMKRDTVVDSFESFIWTDRYLGRGDMQLVVDPTADNKQRLKMGTHLIHTNTDRPMIITNRLIAEDDEGNPKMTVKAKCLKEYLNRRTVFPNGTGLDWTMSTNLGNAIFSLIRNTVQTGYATNPLDIIPNMSVFNTSGTTVVENVSIPHGNLLEAVTKVADPENIGIKIELAAGATFNYPKLTVHKGVERPNIIFSSTLDNINKEQHLISEDDFYNVAYVWGKEGVAHEIVYGWNTLPTVSGIDRRVLNVDATDIDPAKLTETNYRNQLKSRGKEALKEHKFIRMFDGELTNVNPYQYGVDYYLGDLMHFMDDNMDTQQVRITEYIWAWDGEGLRAYPTFEAV